MGRISVLGSLNIDMVVQVPSLPKHGETVLGGNLLTVPGGKGANQAAAAARLGGDVRMVGRVGVDAFGDQLIDSLVRDRVDVSSIVRDPSAPTGAALIMVDGNGDNIIAVAPGANGVVGRGDLERLAAGISPGDVVVLQLEVPVDAVGAAAVCARRLGATVILNAAPAGAIAIDSLPDVDLLIVNEIEAAALGGAVVDDLMSGETAFKRLGARAGNVIVTLGPAGAVLYAHGAFARIEPFKVEAIDSTAAGDAFVGGTALGLSRGAEITKAMELGAAAGAAAATRVGARSSLPSADDLRRLFGVEIGWILRAE